jgi:histidinol-phosphate aminotransferase
MTAISRRYLVRRIAAGAAAAAVPSLTDPRLAAALGIEPPAAGASAAGGLVRLNRNENAFGPSAKVMATVLETARQLANRYADLESEALRDRIARFHGVAPDQVVLGCGATEILRMAADAFAGPGRKMILALPTFDAMTRFARRAGAGVVAVPLSPGYAHDLSAMLERADATTGLVYVCNPNNPTGTLTRRRDMETFIRQLPDTTRVLIDEAYHHYVGESSDYASFIDRPLDDSRVIVARSFSKIHGLAGLRVGYAIAARETARTLAAGRVSDGVNVVAALAAAAAFDDSEHVWTSARRNVDDRQEFVNQANARMLKTIDSQTNFVMLNTERPAIDVVERFRRFNVLLAQPFPGFDTHVRVSIGTPAEMREFWEIWDLAPVHHGESGRRATAG